MDLFLDPTSAELANLYNVALDRLTVANLHGIASHGNPQWRTEFDLEAMDIVRLVLANRGDPTIEEAEGIVRRVLAKAFGTEDLAVDAFDAKSVATAIIDELTAYRQATVIEGPVAEFAARLAAADIHFRQSRHRDDHTMFEVAVPGERWEIELSAEGTVDVEVFRSSGDTAGMDLVEELFARHTSQIRCR